MASFTGTAFNDTIAPGNVSANVIVTPAGATPGGENDTINGNDGNDVLSGAGGTDSLNGGNGNDDLDGGSGSDTLTGGVGADDLFGGTGNDSLVGGTENDTYRFLADSGVDTVNEAVASGTDVIRIEGAIDPDSVTFQVIGSNLIVRRGALQITVLAQYTTGTGGNARVERVEFDDGTEIDIRNIDPSWLVRNGTEQNETLPSSIFDDVLDGRGGDDSVAGGIGNDELEGGGGNDTLIGDVGADELLGEGGADSLNGGTENDTLDGGAGNDTLTGGDGTDRLAGGTGDDSMNGGLGNDTYRVTAADGADTINESVGGGSDTIQYTDATVAGDLVLEVIGNDLIITAGSARILVLGQYTSGTGANARVEKIKFNGGGQIDLREPDAAWLIRSGTDAAESIGGSNFDDSVSGLDGNDTLSGLVGDDTLVGGSGSDSLAGAAGRDVLIGDAGDDTLNGGLDNDEYVYAAFQGADVVSELAGQGTDIIVLGPGLDAGDFDVVIIGDDLILFGDGGQITVTDQFLTGTGNNARVERVRFDDLTTLDLRNPDPAFLTRQLGENNDSVGGSIFGDTVNGGDGNDDIQAVAGNDALAGGDGNDVLNGGLGDDTLEGNVGNDQLTSGGGSNRFIFRPNDGSDTISGFGDGLDRLAFGDFGPNFNTEGEIIAAAAQVAGNVVITLSNPNGVGATVITINSFLLANLTPSDIDFL